YQSDKPGLTAQCRLTTAAVWNSDRPTTLWQGVRGYSDPLLIANLPFISKFAVSTPRHEELYSDRQSGNVSVTCWQDRCGAWSEAPGAGHLHIACETPINVREQNLHAWFADAETDVPIFYKIIEGIRPAK